MTPIRRTLKRLSVLVAVGAVSASGLSAVASAAQVGQAKLQPKPATMAGGQLPTGPILSGVWCSGPSQCLAVGTDLENNPISVVWNGWLWSYVTTPARGHSLTALGCASWTRCMAVGPLGVIDQWNGTSWRASPTPYSADLLSIVCPAKRLCVAVGKTTFTSKATGAIVWNGQSWRAQALPRPKGAVNGQFLSLACPTAKYCIAVGVYHTAAGHVVPMAVSWNGARWRPIAAPPRRAFAIGCLAPGNCVALADNPLTLVWNGRSWRQVNLHTPVERPGSISCPTKSFCMATTDFTTATWNGRRWSKVPFAQYGALWCGSPRDCMAVGSGTSQWNGHSWHPFHINRVGAFNDGFNSVSCATPTNCMAVGYTNAYSSPQRLAETWNGTSWRLIPGPTLTDVFDTTPLSCPTTSFCMAIGTSAAQRWDGTRWHSTHMPSIGQFQISDVSCTSEDNCVAVGLDVALAWNGTTWTKTNAGIKGQTVDLFSVSCSGAICMASGGHFSSTCEENCDDSFLAEKWTGSAWTISDDVPLGINGLAASDVISCPTSTFCMEGSSEYKAAMMWNGESWQSVPANFASVGDLSCASPTNCLGVGVIIGDFPMLVSVAESWNGTSWSPAAAPPAGEGLGRVSCPAVGTCMAVGADSNLLTDAELWNGTSWTRQVTINP